jgi:predicted flap endonuclease-1-like 5' DNA nuclease
MNDTAAAPVTGAITAAHLTLIVVLAIIVIVAIWWGSRRRREQRRAERELERRRSSAPESRPNAGVTPREATAVDSPPVHPAPPPIVEAPPAAAPAPASPPAAPPEPAAPAASADAAQPITLLKGLGPKVSVRLAEQGITTVGQIAALSPAEAEALDAELGTFRGRMARDRWIEQARLLATGDRAAYEAQFGKLG